MKRACQFVQRDAACQSNWPVSVVAGQIIVALHQQTDSSECFMSHRSDMEPTVALSQQPLLSCVADPAEQHGIEQLSTHRGIPRCVCR